MVNNLKVGFTHESQASETREWYTPPYIFKALNLDFDMDVASPGKDIVPWIPAAKHLTTAENGLLTAWCGRIWLNPPYDSNISSWLSKFISYNGEGIMLIFSRTDTLWFHKYAIKADALLFCKGRISFIRGDKTSKVSSPGNGSLLLAKGEKCVDALKNSNLGFFHSNNLLSQFDLAGSSRKNEIFSFSKT